MSPSRAGSREKKYRKNTGIGIGRISDRKIAWLRSLVTGQISIHEMKPEEFDEEYNIQVSSEPGNAYLLLIPVPGRRYPLIWNFSSMTAEELKATRQFFEYLFDLADPIVRERDKVAADAFAKGDDSFSRVFRTPPQLIIRKREKRTNDKGVHNGPEDSSSGAGSDRDSG